MKTYSNGSLRYWLGKQRLQNYGYNYKPFRKMSNLKTRMVKKLWNTPEGEVRKSLANSGFLGSGRRLTREPGYVKNKKGKYVRQGKKSWHYTTGQSFNEEYLNMLSLATTKGKKSFYERTQNWNW